MSRESVDVKRAKDILRGQEEGAAEILALAKKLKKERAFGVARKILALARRDPQAQTDPVLKLHLGQQHALCTYKDADLQADLRLDRALEILLAVDDLKTTRNQETLGLAGAIHKRKWEVDSQRAHLERSLFYYRRGYEAGDPAVEGYDFGYTGVNAAFVLDLLASQEEDEAEKAGTTSESARQRREQARKIRAELVDLLTKLLAEPRWEEKNREWWTLVTLGEAYFGLGDYEKALPWLRDAAALEDVPEWERESTVRQLAALARLHDQILAANGQAVASPAWDALAFLGDFAALSAATGKVGLALSGGGFRASLFHIGVLARLAEMDVLRSVEVLSCVSGGSIVGAHYYLEVRNLLQTVADVDITREHYIEIVRRIARDFLAGVQRNIRTRVAAGLWTNLKIAFVPNYSRKTRVGELYEKEIYSKVQDGEGGSDRWLNDLKIRPLGEVGFSPKDQNWRRRAKVPMLVLNATALNTGHNWQLTASWMGEPPSGIDAEVDGNYRLRRMYYEDAPGERKKIRLGEAAAASSCVPGLFEPIAFADLYPDRVVRLVDGGVHDNQGTASLLEQGCTVALVSDASGQMGAQDHPSNSLLGVPLRTNSILQARVRQAQYHELDARRRSCLLQGLMFIHLKKDLDVSPVDWIDCPDPYDASDEALPPERRGPLTRYGIRKDVQRKLAAVRTDLDSFSDVESFALMTSGYCMTEYELPRSVKGFQDRAPRESWEFLKVEEAMKTNTAKGLDRQLAASASLAFRIWKLSAGLRITSWLLGIAAAVALVWFFIRRAGTPVPVTLGGVSLAVVGAVAVSVVLAKLLSLLGYRKTLGEIAFGLGLSLAGLAAGLHLHVFDKLFLRQGKLERVLEPGMRD